MEITEQEQIDNAIKWLEALLSGNYKQAPDQLGDEETGFCCWGLGCFIVKKDYSPSQGWDTELYKYLGFKDKDGLINPRLVIDLLEGYTYGDLAGANDSGHVSFKQIAEYLIQNPNNFFPHVAEAITKHFANENSGYGTQTS